MLSVVEWVELFEKHQYGTISILIFITILMNSKRIFESYSDFKKHRILTIKAALSDDEVSSKMKAHLKSELNVEHFRLIHGVKLSVPMLNALFILNSRIEKSVSFKHLVIMSKSSPFLQGIDNESYRIRLSRFENVSLLYNLVLGCIILFIGITVLIFSLSFRVLISTTMLSVILIFLGLIMLKESRPFFSIRFINDALNDYQNLTK